MAGNQRYDEKVQLTYGPPAMTQTLTPPAEDEIVYPGEDGEPLAESYDHLYAILVTLEVLRPYLTGQPATVLADPFLYYSPGLARLRIAPDVMVIFDVAQRGRDSYKRWQEGPVPGVIFEIISPSTRSQDTELTKTLYQQLGVKEYWLFDPKGEGMPEQLRGYQLVNNGAYQPIWDQQSQVLGLHLLPEGQLLGFDRLDNRAKLLTPAELPAELADTQNQAKQERLPAEGLAKQLKALGIELELSC